MFSMSPEHPIGDAVEPPLVDITMQTEDGLDETTRDTILLNSVDNSVFIGGMLQGIEQIQCQRCGSNSHSALYCTDEVEDILCPIKDLNTGLVYKLMADGTISIVDQDILV